MLKYLSDLVIFKKLPEKRSVGMLVVVTKTSDKGFFQSFQLRLKVYSEMSIGCFLKFLQAEANCMFQVLFVKYPSIVKAYNFFRNHLPDKRKSSARK